MLHHILYIASPAQLDFTKKALVRMAAKKIGDLPSQAELYHFAHPLLNHLVLEVSLLSDLNAITPHLRQNPVDLLIYDERNGAQEARAALAAIRADVKALADLWGPDFFFPMSRVVAILEKEANDAVRAFELGRVHVRDVCIAPKNTAQILRWLVRILTHGLAREHRSGMALSGGGLEGFLYQTGVLHALQDALEEQALDGIHVYTGISSGSIASALMAAQVPTEEVIKAMIGQSQRLPTLTGSLLFDLAGKTIGKRMISESIGWAGLDPAKWTQKFLQAIPTGLFKGAALKKYLKEAIETFGAKDEFTSLKKELYIGATDQDTFEHVTFGLEPWQHVAVSDALRASCALPPFFTPELINGRLYIDGQVTKTVNLELLVDKGCRLIFIIDPLKPLATLTPGSLDKRGGLFAMIQTIKALVHTRFQSALTHMTERFPDVDFLVFQPDEECAQLMAGSPMRYRLRTEIVLAAYRQTLRQLRERHHIYKAKLQRFGFSLKDPAHLLDLEQTKATSLEHLTDLTDAAS